MIEFRSDTWSSDENPVTLWNGWDSFYGPLGIDDVQVAGSNLSPPLAQGFDFEDGLQGWVPGHCAGVGSYFGVAPLSQYAIADPCFCALSGNVVELHDDSYQHPEGQHERALSPVIDRVADLGDPGYLEYTKILADWVQYTDLPLANGVLFRPGWSYYPWEDPQVPGLIGWSPRVGLATAFYGPDPAGCDNWRSIGTDWGLPADCQKVRFIFEIFGSCEEFGIDPCSGVTNFSPLIDNLQVRTIRAPDAPMLSFVPGCEYQDGFGQSAGGFLSRTDPGNADVTQNVRAFHPDLPARLGDSLAVSGPYPGTQSQWEAKLWFRLARRGPGQNTNALYNSWKGALLAAKGIDFFTGPNPPFTWGQMDSVESGSSVRRDRFCSQFRDGPSPGGLNLPPDPNYNWGGGGEQAEGNEIIPDLALTPGTMIQYFVTANFIADPSECSYLPDTSGGNFGEFEILPSYRLADGDYRFPGFLYVDASNRASDQKRIEAALWDLHSGGAGPIPEPRPWDRYDYADAAWSLSAPFARQPGGNSGATVYQLLGYRSILFDLGTSPSGSTAERDWIGLEQWLASVTCGASHRVQALYLSGSSMPQVIDELRPAFLDQSLGATSVCDSYSDPGCPPGEVENDENFCVRLEPSSTCQTTPQIPMDVQGNWCPVKTPFGVLGVTGTGAGNLVNGNAGSGGTTEFAQVRNDRESSEVRYRSIINGFHLGSLAARAGDDPAAECPSDSASVVEAIRAELGTAFAWLSCRDLAADPLVRDPCTYYPPHEVCPVSDVASDPAAVPMVNSLGASRPNPAGARTVISYSLAKDGPARLEIFSVDGRRVRVLADEVQKAGVHQADWDGTDGSGHRVGAGIYWSRLQIGSWTSDRKMVVLR